MTRSSALDEQTSGMCGLGLIDCVFLTSRELANVGSYGYRIYD